MKRTRPATQPSLRLTNLIQQAFPSSTYPSRKAWQYWVESVSPSYEDPRDEKKIAEILYSRTTGYEARMFEMLCLMRNFTAHLFNDRSMIFQDVTYEMVFSNVPVSVSLFISERELEKFCVSLMVF